MTSSPWTASPSASRPAVFYFLVPNEAGATACAPWPACRTGRRWLRWRGAPLDAAARRAFGYMPEERGLYPGMLVLEQLVYLGRLYGLTAAEARSSDARVDWSGSVSPTSATARSRRLSQVNQQRVQLAAALVHAPELLVLDEPFAASTLWRRRHQRRACGARGRRRHPLLEPPARPGARTPARRWRSSTAGGWSRWGASPTCAGAARRGSRTRRRGPEGRWDSGLDAARVTNVSCGTRSLAPARWADAQGPRASAATDRSTLGFETAASRRSS